MSRGTKNKTVLKLVILAIALQEVGGGAVAPALADIMAANPTVAPTTILLIQTAPYAAAIFMAPIYGAISRKIKKRTLALAAIATFIVFGAAPFFLSGSIPAIIFCRVMFGVAIGVLVPMAVGLCTDFFEGKERASMIGLVQAVACIGGIVFQTAGGYLCTISWNCCFLIYLISIPILIFAYFALPEPQYAANEEEEAAQKAEIAKLSFKEKFPPIVWLFYLEVIVFMITILILVNNIAIFITMEGWGGSIEAGYALSVHSLFGFIGGLIFAPFTRVFKKWTVAVAILLAAGCFALIWFAQNYFMAAAGCALVVIIPSLILCGTWNNISNTVAPAFATIAVSFCVSAQYIGQFIQPYFSDVVNSIFGLGLGRDGFMVATATCLVLFVVLVIQSALMKEPEAKRATAVLTQES